MTYLSDMTNLITVAWPFQLTWPISWQDQKFLHSFEDNSDYVYDVQWSPIHPALFASVDGDGRLDLWNLNNETEVTLHFSHSTFS